MKHGPRLPGTTLLKIGRVLFNERFQLQVVRPTVSDLQRELANAGSSRVGRARARWRGYRAFWTVALIAPFASWSSPDAMASSAAFARLTAASILFSVFAVLNPGFGGWFIVAIAAGALCAFVLHLWYDRHPSELPAPADPQRRTPQINFSSTEVAGNVGGLIFAIGSVLIAAVALPSVMWFLFTATVAGAVLAWALVAWHTNHPNRGLPENRISLR